VCHCKSLFGSKGIDSRMPSVCTYQHVGSGFTDELLTCYNLQYEPASLAQCRQASPLQGCTTVLLCVQQRTGVGTVSLAPAVEGVDQ
jgi:hypothetical protein